MNWFETLSASIVAGSALGAVLAGFFAYRRGAREKVLSAIVDDQDRRIKQLEADRDRLAKQVQILEAEKRLPLDGLTKLIVDQHAAQMASSTALAGSIEQLTRVVERLAGTGVEQ